MKLNTYVKLPGLDDEPLIKRLKRPTSHIHKYLQVSNFVQSKFFFVELEFFIPVLDPT